MNKKEMKKPKGYWIEFNVDKPDVVHDYNQRGFTPKETDIHVVEYSAYQELEQKLNKAIKALEEAAEYHNTDDVNGEAGYIAWKALKEIRGE